MSEDALGQELAELDAFLIEAVHVPDEALEHHFIFEMSEQSTCRCFRGQPQESPIRQCWRASAARMLCCSSHHLPQAKAMIWQRHLRALSSGGDALELDIHSDLALFVSDELHRTISVPWWSS